MKSKRSKIMVILIIIGVLLVLALATFIPTLSLKTQDMRAFEDSYITVYYENEEAAAKDVFELADGESERVAQALGFDTPQDITIYIYDNQSTLQTKKYGFIALLFDLDWYVGDNRGTDVIMTSPANPGSAHDYDTVKQTAIHEMVHAYNSLLNKEMTLWINEGLAVYLTGQAPSQRNNSDSSFSAPSIDQIHTSDPIEFADISGYQFSYTYVEYLDKNFGWENVILYAETNDFVLAFGQDETEIYDGWVEYLKENYA